MSWEIVNGGIDDGETPLAAAKKELEEEAGLKAGRWKSLGYIETGTGIVNCRMHLFLARDLEHGTRSDEDVANIRVKRVPLSRVFHMVDSGKLVHAPSVVAVLKARARLSPTL
jgi:ADP-ribose pyrophosphatase